MVEFVNTQDNMQMRHAAAGLTNAHRSECCMEEGLWVASAPSGPPPPRPRSAKLLLLCRPARTRSHLPPDKGGEGEAVFLVHVNREKIFTCIKY